MEGQTGYSAAVLGGIHLEEGLAPSALVCQVVGCNEDLTYSKTYCQKKRTCSFHMQADSVQLQMGDPTLWRFCQQCGKFEHLYKFDDIKRSCRARLAKRRSGTRALLLKKGCTSKSDDGNQPGLVSEPLPTILAAHWSYPTVQEPGQPGKQQKNSVGYRNGSAIPAAVMGSEVAGLGKVEDYIAAAQAALAATATTAAGSTAEPGQATAASGRSSNGTIPVKAEPQPTSSDELAKPVAESAAAVAVRHSISAPLFTSISGAMLGMTNVSILDPQLLHLQALDDEDDDDPQDGQQPTTMQLMASLQLELQSDSEDWAHQVMLPSHQQMQQQQQPSPAAACSDVTQRGADPSRGLSARSSSAGSAGGGGGADGKATAALPDAACPALLRIRTADKLNEEKLSIAQLQLHGWQVPGSPGDMDGPWDSAAATDVGTSVTGAGTGHGSSHLLPVPAPSPLLPASDLNSSKVSGMPYSSAGIPAAGCGSKPSFSCSNQIQLHHVVIADTDPRLPDAEGSAGGSQSQSQSHDISLDAVEDSAVARAASTSSNRLKWLIQQVQLELQNCSTDDVNALDEKELDTLLMAALLPADNPTPAAPSAAAPGSAAPPAVPCAVGAGLSHPVVSGSLGQGGHGGAGGFQQPLQAVPQPLGSARYHHNSLAVPGHQQQQQQVLLQSSMMVPNSRPGHDGATASGLSGLVGSGKSCLAGSAQDQASDLEDDLLQQFLQADQLRPLVHTSSWPAAAAGASWLQMPATAAMPCLAAADAAGAPAGAVLYTAPAAPRAGTAPQPPSNISAAALGSQPEATPTQLALLQAQLRHAQGTLAALLAQQHLQS